jgi:hypothetical protein
MLDSERASKTPLDYLVLKAFTDPRNGARLAIGNKVSMDENLGCKLCQSGHLRDVTARVADTIAERAEDLEATEKDHEARIATLEEIIADNDLTLEP